MSLANHGAFALACLGVMAHSSALAQTPPVAVSAPWAQAMCTAWNVDANMDPCGGLLRLVAKVPGEWGTCA